MKYRTTVLVLVSLALAGCDNTTTGKSCLGSDGDTLVEALSGQCKAGDTIATKNPAFYCDFRYSVAFNGYNSAFCIFSGHQADERVSKGE